MLPSRRRWPEVPLEEIVRRSRILVIDDQEFPYLKLFKRDGYTVTKWNDVTRLTDIETGKFDLILLDLLGIGKAESAEQGLGILQHIRQVRPAQLVIAYSQADWSVRFQPFFEVADAVLEKSADYLDFKRSVNELLAQRYSLGFYIERILAEAPTDGMKLDQLERKARQAILSGREESFRRYLTRHIEDAVTVDRILAIVQIAIGVAQLWRS